MNPRSLEPRAASDDGVPTAPAEAFGCAVCWPADPDAAWAARRALSTRAEPVDESHFHVLLLNCPSCRQSYVSVFTETIDWADGDDPQEWTTLPVTADEADRLAAGEAPTEEALCALGPGRRSLRRDVPKGRPPRTFWDTGLTVGWHD